MTDDEALARAPRLTRLELQGFKSFANRTVFAFEPGITAVVGPNGSGKSNVADAVRWVLGEQGQHALRARKSDDIIFTGGQGRAQAGMAEATLTFDNSDGWLPIDFAEVSVTRRAFRSGENHYLINGRKVRLKDVSLLTAGLGQSHLVVGQGLVDAALSQRAEERRGLFEHAADLAGLRLKVAESEKSLNETEANTTRLADLLAELEPRLRTLERAARQAKEWQALRDRLRRLQGTHYRVALQAAATALTGAQAAQEVAESAAAAASAEVDRLASASERAATSLTTAREELARHDERRAALEDRLRRQTHERDLAAARIDSLAKRRADMDDARAGLDERVQSVTADLARLHAELRDLERATAEARETAASHGRALAAGGAARSDLERRFADASRRLVEGERQEAALLRQEAVLIERTTATAAERERARTAIAERASRIAALDADRTVAAETAATGAGHAAALESRLAELALAHERAVEESTNTRAAVDRLERRLGEAATRWEVLQRLHESGAGLHAGVRAVLAAGREDRLGGIVGTVAELLVVPEALETALEVALGSRLQDVVVARWVDAEAAITYLKRGGAGRSTFQPLDTVRGDRVAALPLPLQDVAGVRGIAADLVSVSAEVRPVIAALLSRTLVVDDLETARAALPHLSPGWSVVTIDGEIVRVGGSVTGGAAVRESGTLGRERELRELPAAVAGIETDLVGARERWDETERAARAIADEQRKGQEEQVIARAAAVERRRQHDQLEAWLTDLHGEQARAESRLRELGAEQERLADELRETRGQTRQVQRDRQQAEAARAEAERELTTHGAACRDLERAAADDGRRLAGLEERLRGERRREAGLHAQERALAEELKLRAERAAVLDRERETLVAELARLSHEVAASADELGDAVAAREPLRMEAMGAEIAVGRLAEATQAARAARAERERERDHAGFALERARQEDAALRQRIVEDLEVSHADEVLAWEVDDEAIPAADREAEIARLRERLRRIGYVGEDAVAEYEREAAQQAYLREQLADVEGAAAALRALLAELRQTMRTRFDETFARVAEAFGEAFAVLFGGGSARLVLTTGDEGGEPGIDIIAQPPGKRLQSLAVLSGGERALTAAALLFAILKVNPAPFCLLDEVDAALDEANVVRFRECLQELAARSQVIVVTHNRGTIEIADTLYGVSMGASGVSQVLSLRLSDSLPAD